MPQIHLTFLHISESESESAFFIVVTASGVVLIDSCDLEQIIDQEELYVSLNIIYRSQNQTIATVKTVTWPQIGNKYE